MLLPTKGFTDISNLYVPEEDGEVALCNLGSIVVTNIEDDEDYEKTAYILAKITDNTIERGVYPFPQVEYTAKKRRSIGIGMTDVAHLIAREGLKFDSQEGRTFVHRMAEKHSYMLHKASVALAKEKGKCEWINKTKYYDGWLPIDTYAKGVDIYHDADLQYDWEALRMDIRKWGVRFSVLESFMPTESSSLLTNSCNGVYPIRNKEIYKSSRKGAVYFRAPDMDTLNYQNAFSIDSQDLVKYYAIIQKFTGQGISADFYTKLDGTSKTSVMDVAKRVLLASKLGMKTFYYENFKTGEDIEESDEDACESCKL